MTKAKRILNEFFSIKENYKEISKEIYKQIFSGGLSY